MDGLVLILCLLILCINKLLFQNGISSLGVMRIVAAAVVRERVGTPAAAAAAAAAALVPMNTL